MRVPDLALSLGFAVALASCGNEGAQVATKVTQTRFPGEVSAGGGTSGEAMAQATQAGSRQAGTPGIPQGAEGNAGGTQMGGTAGASTLGGTGAKTAQQSPTAPAQAPKQTEASSPAKR
jgi:hypothetical protein